MPRTDSAQLPAGRPGSIVHMQRWPCLAWRRALHALRRSVNSGNWMWLSASAYFSQACRTASVALVHVHSLALQ